ncbi:methyl-accepting chemotaxis protein [Williamwhitmania taraxaci]|uniref:Methyl-accepting chemotaxis protein n=1 Tax=Williamwhitmania taraxaci TaxID=1640674 RepID=A0A1G6JYP6_9BACT|nr:HAMP domain-containing methyl-accepting chemotaxis protein [Williamwhitmania taraxaci]SDC23929.1 Methyl-accepting chemotaxis protein [Williamwhitmania taraxaci]
MKLPELSIRAKLLTFSFLLLFLVNVVATLYSVTEFQRIRKINQANNLVSQIEKKLLQSRIDLYSFSYTFNSEEIERSQMTLFDVFSLLDTVKVVAVEIDADTAAISKLGANIYSYGNELSIYILGASGKRVAVETMQKNYDKITSIIAARNIAVDATTAQHVKSLKVDKSVASSNKVQSQLSTSLGYLSQHIKNDSLVKLLANNREQLDILLNAEEENSNNTLGSVGETLFGELSATQAQLAANSDSVFSKTIVRIAAFIGVCLIIGIFIAFLFSKKLSGSIINLAEITNTLSKGDLAVKPKDALLARTDELGMLANSLEHMRLNLRNVVMGVQDCSQNLFSSSQQLKDSSQSLSTSANYQASSVEELSSSMEEIASSATQNNSNANRADTTAEKCAEAMKQIHITSKDAVENIHLVEQKIAIVNEIAQQTNLLALNAAVEAARAGQYGASFGVVAKEVRNLAEKSRKAADEIAKVAASGVALSQKTVLSVIDAIPLIENNQNAVQEIAAASIEQSSSINHINTAINEMNGTVQENAAASEQLAANADAVTAHAETLKEMVAFFKMS